MLPGQLGNAGLQAAFDSVASQVVRARPLPGVEKCLRVANAFLC
jgi:hypothetical protein